MTLPLRLARVVFAFQATWCLGCGSLDVLLERALGAQQEMSCDTPAPQTRTVLVAIGTDHLARATSDCGCDHCVANEALPAPLAASPPPLPRMLTSIVESPLSIERKPLVPPPLV